MAEENVVPEPVRTVDPEKLTTLQEVDWPEHFDERQLKEIEFAGLYAEQFNHGTTGHNQLILIARMKELLDQFQGLVDEL